VEKVEWGHFGVIILGLAFRHFKNQEEGDVGSNATLEKLLSLKGFPMGWNIPKIVKSSWSR
jgi:hypothetical protein